MTHPLTIHSPFQDVNELVEGLAPFFTGEHLVLRAPDDVPEGEWIRFEVLLVDGTPGLSGLGQHAGTNDNGEEFAAERFDVYLGELQFDEGASSEAWAQIVAAFDASQTGAEGEAAQSAAEPSEGAEPADAAAAEADVSDGGEAAAEDGGEAASAETFSDNSEATSTVDLGSLGVSLDAAAEDEAPAAAEASAADLPAEAAAGDVFEEAPADSETFEAFEADDAVEEAAPAEAAPPVAPPAVPRSMPDLTKPAAPPARPAPAPVVQGPLTRPTLPASWEPAAEPPVARPSLGLFAWGERGLPVPARPPRPAGDVGRIDPAPRPASA